MAGIILFDGFCNFCSGSVQFILKRDDKAYFQFAALQSEAGEKLLKTYNVNDSIDSLVLIENEQVYIKSSAALRVCKHLKGLWKGFYILLFVPRLIRDFVYDFIAKNRYKLFGKKDQCMMPTPEIRKRFLE